MKDIFCGFFFFNYFNFFYRVKTVPEARDQYVHRKSMITRGAP